MYLHLELKRMATDRLQEAVERLHYLHSLMSQTPGFLDAQIWEYLGNPAQYLVVRAWTEGAAHAAYRASDLSKTFAASRPAHFIYENYAVEEWDCLLETAGSGAGDYLVWLRQSIDPSAQEVLLAARKREEAAAVASGGVGSLRTSRMLPNDKADPSRLMSLQRWSGRDAYGAYLSTVPTTDVRPEGLVEAYKLIDELKA